MLKARADHWWLVPKVAIPATVSLGALVGVLFTLLGETEFRLFDHGDAPEDSVRFIGIAAVLTLNCVAAAIIRHLMSRAEPRVPFLRYSRRCLEALSFVVLATLGAGFAVLDMTFGLGESTEAVLAALALGLLALGPLLLDRAIRVRSLLVVIAFYSVFACWILVQRNIDWNMRRHFLRAYSQIRPGMTTEQVEDVIHNQFRGKRPVARFDNWGVQYTLDPDDGRFNSEIIVIRMVAGKVVEVNYLPD